MNVTTTITHKGAPACFEIRKEAPGIYQALLVSYEGETSDAPPSGITLIRGIRYWAGSVNDKALLTQLGLSIEQSLAYKS